jgi:hypothetical protein
MINTRRHILPTLACLGLLVLFMTACGPTVSQLTTQPTATVNSVFQAQLSPVPTVASYRCGAWSSNNAPFTYDTITIYARLVGNTPQGVSGAKATAVAHFKAADQTLDQQPVSDKGGYVTFSLSLQGRQPSGIPTTVSVDFTLNGHTIACTPAFFTPR